MVESVANAVTCPFEVISSEDMLSRVAVCNEKLKIMQTQRGSDWKWTNEFILLGSDVKSLFPSLSAKRTGEAVRIQFAKSEINWTNVDWRQVTLYVKLQEAYWTNVELKDIEMYLPKRRKNIGRPLL